MPPIRFSPPEKIRGLTYLERVVLSRLKILDAILEDERQKKFREGADAIMREELARARGELPYFELAGYRLELQNHGKPQCKCIEIITGAFSWTKPQARMEFIDGKEHWYYNFMAIFSEAECIGQDIPNMQQWKEMFLAVGGNVEKITKALNIPMVGYIGTKYAEPIGVGTSAYFWSVIPNSCVVMLKDWAMAQVGKDELTSGMLLRFFAKDPKKMSQQHDGVCQCRHQRSPWNSALTFS